jgi:phage terminase large subunit-like protein
MRELAMRDWYYLNTQILGWEQFYEPLHRPVCDWFHQTPAGRMRLTLIPRGCFKTTIGTEGQIIGRWLENPSLRFLIMHQKCDVAEKALGQIKFHAEENEKLRFIAPDIFWEHPKREAKRWLADQIDIKRKWHRVPSCMAVGLDASVTGLHFDWLIFDDLVTEDNIGTPEMLEKPKNRIREANPLLQNRMKSKIDIIGTRWHLEDAYGWLIKEVLPKDHVYKRSLLEDSKSIFPSKFPDDDIHQMKLEMGTWKFAALMMNDPVPADARMFMPERVKWVEQLPDVPLTFFTAIDPNRREEKQHDPGVVMTFARDAEGNHYQAEITHRRFNVDDLVETTRAHVERWNPIKVLIETTAGQNYLHQWLLKEQVENGAPYTIIPISRGPNAHKAQRILRCQPVVERGRLHLSGDARTNPLYLELEVYPFGSHDHCLDALADIVQNGYDPRRAKRSEAQPRGQFTLENICRVMREHKLSKEPYRTMDVRGARW